MNELELGVPVSSDSSTPKLREAKATVVGDNELLFSTLYTQLHQLAERQLRANSGVPLSPTTLLHETYLCIVQGPAKFPDQWRFMSYASRAMRSLIIDLIRQRRAQKRGGEFHITQLDTQILEQTPAVVAEEAELTELSKALDELAVNEPRLAEVVDLKYFCGFSLVEIAAMRGVSDRTVQRDWDKARLILYRSLRDTPVAVAH